jgi:DHA1 family multidrug resistance protein-like MFS transporter
MLDILRESTAGEILNRVSGGRILPYPDQRPTFVVPERYLATFSPASASTPITRVASAATLADRHSAVSGATAAAIHAKAAVDVEKADVPQSDSTLEAGPQPTETALEQLPDTKGFTLVDWYGDDDPENPRNWSFPKRCFVLAQIVLLTFSVYIGSAIYTASTPYVVEKFHVSEVTATLGLSLFVEGYAIGPMILSPLQEIPSFGRNPVYIITLIIFALLQIPTALSTTIGGLLALRFIVGFVGSPALATGGASIGDIFPPAAVPFAVGLWAMGAVAGPVLGPVVGGFAAAANGWRWPIWELAWISGFSSVFLLFLLPETLGDTILLKRARRLRKLTGNQNLRSLSEIKQSEMTTKAIAWESLVRPFQLMIEPAVFFINLYVGFAYAIFYLWFEAFPLVFGDIYHFKGGILGLPFIGIIVGALISYVFYVFYLLLYLYPKFARLNWQVEPEEYLLLAAIAGVFIPISLFMFGWTSRHSVHWIVPIIGAGLYMPGIYLLFQSALVYLPVSYPNYVASILAGNDFFRSSVAAGFPLFGRAFFHNLGIGGGSSLLAGLSIVMLPALWALIIYGKRLRSMSKFAVS